MLLFFHWLLVIVLSLLIFIFILVVALLESLGEVAVGLLLRHVECFNLLSLVCTWTDDINVDFIVSDVVHDEIARV